MISLFCYFNIFLCFQQDLLFIFPEVVFACLILNLIVWLIWLKGIGNLSRNSILDKLLLILFLYLFSIFFLHDFNVSKYLFSTTVLIDYYALVFKIIIVLTTICILIFTRFRSSNLYSSNDWLGYSILMSIAVFFMCILPSIFDLISFYVTIEGLSLTLYALAALFIRHIKRGSEAAMKYFVMGLVSTGFFLLGIYLVYSETGHTSFFKIKQFFLEPNCNITILSYVGVLCLLLGFFFKLAVFPCYFWAPDVYEGVPTPITAFFAITVKISIFSVFLRMFFFSFIELFYFWQMILVFSGVFSMFVGFINAAGADSIKRLLSYASINQMGYILLGLACGTFEGIHSALLYLFLYSFMLLALFGLLLNTHINAFGASVLYVSDLRSLYRTSPVAALSFFSVLLSMGGIPPFVGFLGKYYVFLAVVHSELYLVAFFGLLISAASSFIYLKIIKVALFEIEEDRRIVVYNSTLFSNIIIGVILFFIIAWSFISILMFVLHNFGIISLFSTSGFFLLVYNVIVEGIYPTLPVFL